MKQILFRLKPYLRWMIFGGVLFFLGKALKEHATEIAAIRITGTGWLCLAIALVVTLLAHTWAGWVWGWILREFKQPMHSPWLVQVYLKTNIAKYLPGNVWHYYGRISKVTAAGVPTTTATLSVAIEPLFMVAAALLFLLFGSQINQEFSSDANICSWQICCLVGVMIILHPWFLNPVLQILGKFKGKAKTAKPDDADSFKLERYPFLPVLGEIGFVGLRSMGFVFIFMALTPVSLDQFPMLLNAFSLSWLSTFVIPAAPGGIGVFEASAIALLDQPFSTGIVLSVAALYRLISILAESVGAGLASLDELRFTQK